jgi:hypothetical protein
MPHNLSELDGQARLIRGLLQRQSQSPSSLALQQLVKGCQLAMSSAALLATENSDLRVTNDRRLRKRLVRKQLRTTSNVLLAQQAQEMIQGARSRVVAPVAPEMVEIAPIVIADAEAQAPTPPVCEACNLQGHTMVGCLTALFNR